VVVIQANPFNRSSIQTVIVASITSNLRLADAPGNVFLPTRSSGLPRDSVINVSQVVTLDRSFLTEPVGDVSDRLLDELNAGLRLILGL
jgi:mRNA interferase MazF